MFGKKKKKSDSGALEEAKNWYADRYQLVTVQRNVLAVVTILALAGLGATTVTVAQIADSKTFEPYVIQMEEKSGIMTLVDVNSVEKYSEKEMVKRYFLNKYVSAREGYDINTYEHNYNWVVRVLSNFEVYKHFRGVIDVTRPDSPINFGRTKRRTVQTKSISFIKPLLAQVRFQVKTEEFKIGVPTTYAHYISTIAIEFAELQLDTKERYINPLGFQVVSYRRDEDSSAK